MVTEIERLEAILNKCCHGKKNEFGARLGVSQQAGSAWFKNGTYDVNKLMKAFPEVSTRFILTGEGEVLEIECEQNEDYHLEALGVTREQLESLRSTSLSCDKSHDNNNEGTHVRAYEPSSDTVYCVHEGESVDRALLNMLLAEKAHLQQELAVLRQRNLELEKDNAIKTDRLEAAEHWYRTNIQNKKG